MSLCIACGHLGGEGEGRKPCRNCMALYEREVKQDKKFPPGLSEPAKRNFTPQQWAKFKELERRLQVGSVTMEEAQEQMRKMVQYLNDAPAMREEEAKKREALRALKLY